jgi:glyoxylase-like metal-dependent hydrolase (beta-lactamase superfamily II)
VTTHYHDDHVAGINLLRAVEGSEVWAPANVAPVLEQPTLYDLPCLWFEPVPVDRVLQLGEAIEWHEHVITAHPLPGHTRYAAALEFEADGRRVLATGDQQGGGGPSDTLNYQYRNRFQIDDYVASAELYARLQPDLLITGHWAPREVTPDYLHRLLADGRRLAELHRDLLPLRDVDFGAEGFAARIEPYRTTARLGEQISLTVRVLNPFEGEQEAQVALVVPDGFSASPPEASLRLPSRGEGTAAFLVRVIGEPGRVPVAADVTIGGTRFGQQAEALVTIA